MNYVGYPPAPPGTVMLGDTNAVGMIGWFHKVPDTSWLNGNGQIVAKAAYPDLWAYAQGFLTADQVANPGLFRDVNAATFALPDLSGLFVRGVGGNAPNASLAIGVKQADDFKSHVHAQSNAGSSVQHPDSAGTPSPRQTPADNTLATGGVETRPVNVALVPCIKALRTSLVPSGTISPAYTFATAPEVATGTEAAKAVAPATQGAHQSAAKAWVNFNGTGTVAIRDSYNVAGITDNAVGDWTINFATPMANVNYAGVYAANSNTGAQIRNTYENFDNVVHSLTANRIYTLLSSGGVADSAAIYAAYFGD